MTHLRKLHQLDNSPNSSTKKSVLQQSSAKEVTVTAISHSPKVKFIANRIIRHFTTSHRWRILRKYVVEKASMANVATKVLQLIRQMINLSGKWFHTFETFSYWCVERFIEPQQIARSRTSMPFFNGLCMKRNWRLYLFPWRNTLLRNFVEKWNFCIVMVTYKNSRFLILYSHTSDRSAGTSGRQRRNLFPYSQWCSEHSYSNRRRAGNARCVFEERYLSKCLYHLHEISLIVSAGGFGYLLRQKSRNAYGGRNVWWS